MASRRHSKLIATITIAMVFSALGLFGFYTYNSTVVHIESDTTAQAAAILPAIRIEPEYSDDRPTVIAYLSLKNTSGNRIRIVDTVGLAPLYDVSLQMKTGDAFSPVPAAGQSMRHRNVSTEAKKTFDRETDSVVELLPGSSLVRPIFLSALYNIKQDGHYELQIRYQPDVIIQQAAFELGPLNIISRAFTTTHTFEIAAPKKKERVSRTPSSAPPATLPQGNP